MMMQSHCLFGEPVESSVKSAVIIYHSQHKGLQVAFCKNSLLFLQFGLLLLVLLWWVFLFVLYVLLWVCLFVCCSFMHNSVFHPRSWSEVFRENSLTQNYVQFWCVWLCPSKLFKYAVLWFVIFAFLFLIWCYMLYSLLMSLMSNWVRTCMHECSHACIHAHTHSFFQQTKKHAVRRIYMFIMTVRKCSQQEASELLQRVDKQVNIRCVSNWESERMLGQ